MSKTVLTPKVSVIIPVYNCECYIAQAIESALNQTYSNYEIIVINDGSTDNTRQILQPYLEKIRYFYQENQGLSATRNRGIKMAKGELIALLDADDFFLPNKLQEQIAIFDAQPTIGLVQSGWRVVNEIGEKIEDVQPWHKSPELDLVSWLKWKATNPSGMIFQKKWLERVGGFNENLRRLEDFDIVIRLALAGCRATWFPKVAVCYRQHSGNMTRNLLAQIEVEEKILDQLFSHPHLPPEIQELESELRYGSLIWNCWCLYKGHYFAEMADYLYKSLKFSPVSILKTICDWLYYFQYYASLENSSGEAGRGWQYGEDNKLLPKNYDGKNQPSVFLNQLPEWQRLIMKILPNGLPLVSVVIPAYNNAAYIDSAIESVLNQTYTNYEIIVVDDGSTDNTRQLLEPYLNRAKYIYQENQGAAKARNRGIEVARGEFIAFLDADDFFLPEKLAAQVGCFAEESSLTMVQTGWRFVDEKGNSIKDVEPWQNTEELDLENWLMWQATLPSAMMFRREWLQLNGGFDSRYIPEDLEIVLRLALCGGKATWLRKVCVCYRQRTSSVSGLGNRRRITQELEKLLDDFFRHPHLPDSIREIEQQVKYRSLLWNSWRLYRAGNFSEMASYLQKSLKYTNATPTEAICTWIELFTKLDRQEGNDFNAYSLSQLPEWKSLISNIFNPVVPRVSVIIATYNNAHYILEAIASVFNQTYTSYEVIVIDDGSTDNTRAVLEPYLDQIRYVYQENQGVSHARNLGLEMAGGEFITFLDADDFFLPDKLAKQVACFDACPSLGIVHSGWRLVDETGEKISDIELWHGSLELDLETWVVWKPVTISMMFRRSWIQSAGGFDTRWHHGEDIDLILRLSVNGCEAVWLPKVTYCYRQHRHNATRKSAQQAASMMLVLDNFFSRPNLSSSIRKLEGKSRYYTLSWLAWQAHRNGDLVEMGRYLQQALKYTPFSITETLYHWVDSFNNLYQDYGYEFDVYALTSSDVWQQLISDLIMIV